MPMRIMFRGDSRHPWIGRTFSSGFESRNAEAEGPRYVDRPYRAGAIDPDSGVCVSSRFQAAALFPPKFAANILGPGPDNNYVYAVHLDTDRLLNAHAREVESALGDKVDGVWRNPGASLNEPWSLHSPMWSLFIQENAVGRIAPEQIIAAVACERRWSGQDWQDGGTYRLGDIHYNPNCTAPPEIVDATRRFLEEERASHGEGMLPHGSSGYHASNPHALDLGQEGRPAIPQLGSSDFLDHLARHDRSYWQTQGEAHSAPYGTAGAAVPQPSPSLKVSSPLSPTTTP